jgi:hypothetical protein
VTRNQIIHVHSLLDKQEPESYIRALHYLYELDGAECDVTDPQEATAQVVSLFQTFLKDSRYFEAALLCWGDRGFTPEPLSVKRIWEAMDKHGKLICLGGGVQGKTFTATAKLLLRWCEDPQNTSVKLVSTTGGHVKSNILAGFVKLWNDSAVPLPGMVRENYIGIDINELQASIQKVSIAPGDNGRASLRGFHRLPRKKPHPKFGDMTVLYVIVDEADDVPWGFWTGADNFASGGGRIFAATNPVKKESECAARAEPLQGWSWVNREQTFEWEGQQGWHVIRLDVRQSENYKQKREVFKGIMTYWDAKVYESKGKDHPDYWSFILALYPSASAKYYIVPAFILEDIRGTYNFIRTPHNVASFDPAFEAGGDRPALTTGRYGLANGWRDPNGKLHRIEPSKWVLQVEQQFDIEKKANPLDMADDLIRILKRLAVRPEWFVHDMTGNGTLLYGYLLRKYGQVLGLKWGSKATDKKVFEEDTETAEEQFIGLISEMWFSWSRWAQFGYIKISPMMQTQELFNETSSRKYEQAGKTLLLAESKEDFKANNSGKSCDYSDSMIMLPHLCRMRGQDRPALIGGKKGPMEPPGIWRGEDWQMLGEKERAVGMMPLERIDFVDISEI